jgi:HAD superfamily hydrolase (TIGR01549 family)
MIKAVLYDLGDVFFEAHYWRKWMWEQLMEKTGQRWTFSEFYDLYESWIKNVYEGTAGYEKTYLGFLKSLNFSNIDEFLADSFEKKKYVEKNRKLFPGVKKTLKRLKECGIMNIIMTDNEKPAGEVRKEVLQKFLIDQLIYKIYTSCELGITKPDPSFFSYVLSDLRLQKNVVVFVGHDVDEINGAKKFGIKVIEFNNYLKNHTNADYRIGKFSQIPDIIKSIQPV